MRIRSQILVVVAAVALLPLLLMGFLAFRYSQGRLEKHADQNLLALGQRMSSEVDAFAYRALEEVRTDSLIPSLVNFLASQPPARNEQQAEILELLRSAVTQDPVNVTSCALIDTSGRNLLDTSPGQEGHDESDRAWLKLVRQQGLPVILAEIDSTQTRGTLWVQAPVRNSTGRTLGFLRLKYDLATLQQIIRQLSNDSSAQTYALVLDEQNRVLAHGANADALGQTIILPPTEGNGLGWARLAATTNPHEPMDRTVTVALSHAPWRVAVIQTEKVFHQSLLELKRTMLLLAILMTVLCMAAAYVAAGRLSQPIRLLAERAEKLGRNDDLPLSLSGVGTGEVETLNRTFNEMSDRLRATVDDLHRRVSELKASDERVRRLLEFSPMAMTVRDTQDRTIMVNRRFTELFGYTLEDVPNLQRWFELAYPDPVYREEISSRRSHNLKQWEKTGQIEIVKAQVRCRDGSIKQIEFHSELLDDRHLISYVDLTEHHRLEEKLRQSQKMEAIGTLAGGIAHDFNNILTGIMGNTQLVEMDLPPEHPAMAGIKRVKQASQRAKNLVNQILSFSRQQEPKREPIQLHCVVEEALNLLRPSLPATIDIHAHLLPTSPLVLADSTQLHQVLMNLVTNAAHAMAKTGGRLEIRQESVVVDEEAVRQQPLLHRGHFVRLTVSDTGCGMDKATVSRIFDPFFTTKQPGEGTGLGLSAVLGIIQKHDGDLIVYSEPKVGTTFHIYLPAITTTHPVAAATQPASLPQGQGKRVLVVDDEEIVGQVTSEILQRLGYHTVTFDDSTLALQAFTKDPSAFDLVITDLTMPKMTGTALAAAIRQVRPTLPIVLCTGFGGNLNAAEASRLKLHGPLRKPFSLESLAAIVADALPATSES